MKPWICTLYSRGLKTQGLSTLASIRKRFVPFTEQVGERGEGTVEEQNRYIKCVNSYYRLMPFSTKQLFHLGYQPPWLNASVRLSFRSLCFVRNPDLRENTLTSSSFLEENGNSRVGVVCIDSPNFKENLLDHQIKKLFQGLVAEPSTSGQVNRTSLYRRRA